LENTDGAFQNIIEKLASIKLFLRKNDIEKTTIDNKICDILFEYAKYEFKNFYLKKDIDLAAALKTISILSYNRYSGILKYLKVLILSLPGFEESNTAGISKNTIEVTKESLSIYAKNIDEIFDTVISSILYFINKIEESFLRLLLKCKNGKIRHRLIKVLKDKRKAETMLSLVEMTESENADMLEAAFYTIRDIKDESYYYLLPRLFEKKLKETVKTEILNFIDNFAPEYENWRNPDSEKTQSNLIRVFISSTFNDFKVERDALQERVFPELRKLCSEMGYRFQPIDLRWGINTEVAIDHKTVDICLKEIERCQHISPYPNFIMIMGNRYGWRPLPTEINEYDYKKILKYAENIKRPLIINAESINPASLLSKWYQPDHNSLPMVYCIQPRAGALSEYVDPEKWWNVELKLRLIIDEAVKYYRHDDSFTLKKVRSTTEYEILRGMLDIPADQSRHVFGYFRNIDNIEDLDNEVIGSPGGKGELYIDSLERKIDLNSRSFLKELKQKIKDKIPGNIFEYQARWEEGSVSTDHIDNMCEDVYRSLACVIKQRIASDLTRGIHEKEIDAHKSFCEERSRNFVGRLEIIDKIRHYLRFVPGEEKSATNRPLAIRGEGGSGKSSLMSKIIIDLIQEQKNESAVIFRFLGTTPDSSNIKTLLESLCSQISKIYEKDLPQEFKKDAKQMFEIFNKCLNYATKQKPMIIFLDALDQLSDSENAHELKWLPWRLPENVRIVISTLSAKIVDGVEYLFEAGKCISAIRNAIDEKDIINLEKMKPEEGKELLESWLMKSRRTLVDEQKKIILNKFDKCGLPLYLKLIFEESRLWKSYTDASQIKLGDNISGVINNLFERLSSSANHGQLLVSRCLGYIAASRNGLSEEELLSLLTFDDEFWVNFIVNSHHDFENNITIEDFDRGDGPEKILELFKSDKESDVIKYFKNNIFSSKLNQLLNNYNEEQNETILKMLIAEFNAVIKMSFAGNLKNKCIYDREVFEKVIISDKIRKIFDDYNGNDRRFDKQCVNRWLIEKAFGDHIKTGGRKFPDAPWSRLYFEIKPYLTERTADNMILMSFFHRQFGTVVKERYLSGKNKTERHNILANYFESLPLSETAENNARKCANLPYHLKNAGMWKKLENILADFNFVEAKLSSQNMIYDLINDFEGISMDPPIIKTALFVKNEYFLRCPHCMKLSVIKKKDLGNHKNCDNAKCQKAIKINKFTIKLNEFERVDEKLLNNYSMQDDKPESELLKGELLEVLDFLKSNSDILLHRPELTFQLAVNFSADTLPARAALKSKEHKLLLNNNRENFIFSGLIKMSKSKIAYNDPVFSVSPDGKRIACGEENGKLIIFDIKNGIDIEHKKAHEEAISSISYSPFGDLILTASYDKTLKLWECGKTLELKAELSGHENKVLSCGFSPDNKKFISSSEDRTIIIWDAVTLKKIIELKRHTGIVFGAAFSPDGRCVLSCSEDKTIKIWRVSDGKMLYDNQLHSDCIRCCSFSPDGKYFISCSDDKTVKIFEFSFSEKSISVKQIISIECESEPRFSSFSPDAEYFQAGFSDGTIVVWEFCPDKSPFYNYYGYFDDISGEIIKCNFSPDGKQLIYSSDKVHTIEVLNLNRIKKDKLKGDKSSEKNILNYCSFTPDSRSVISAYDNGCVKLITNDGSDEKIIVEKKVPVIYSSFLPLSGDKIIIFYHNRSDGVNNKSNNYGFDIIDIKNNDPRQIINASYSDEVKFGDISPDGAYVTTIVDGKTIIAWHLKSESEIGKIEGFKKNLEFCKISPDGRYMIVGASEVIKIIDFKVEEYLHLYDKKNKLDEKSKLDTVFMGYKKFDAQGKSKKYQERPVKNYNPFCCAFSPDSKNIAVAMAKMESHRGLRTEYFINISTIATGFEVAHFWAHSDIVNDCQYSPDGKYLASASNDRTLKIWDASSRKLITEYSSKLPIKKISFSPDGSYIAAGDNDGKILFLKLMNFKSLCPVINAYEFEDEKIIFRCSFCGHLNYINEKSAGQIVECCECTNKNKLNDFLIYVYSENPASGVINNSGSSEIIENDQVQIEADSPEVAENDLNNSKEQVITITDTYFEEKCNFSEVRDFWESVSRPADVEKNDLKITPFDELNNSCIKTIPFIDFSPCYAAVSPDSKYLLCANKDSAIKIFEIYTGNLIYERSHISEDTIFKAFSKNYKFQLISLYDGKGIKILDNYSGNEIVNIHNAAGIIISADFSTDCSKLVLAFLSNEIMVLDLNSKKSISIDKIHSGGINCIKLSSSGDYVASASDDKTIKIFKSSDLKESVCLKGHDSEVEYCAFSTDDHFLVSASADKKIILWKMSKKFNNYDHFILKGHKDKVVYCEFSPSGNKIISVSTDSEIKIWETSSKKELASFLAHSGQIKHCSFSSDEKYLVSVLDDDTVKIWDIESIEKRKKITASISYMSMNGFVWCSISSDKNFLDCIHKDGTLRVFDISSANQVKTQKFVDGKLINSGALSTDGSQIVFGHGNNLEIFDVSGCSSAKISAHDYDVHMSLFMPSESILLTISKDDKNVKAWHNKTGEKIKCGLSLSKNTNFMRCSFDGKSLAVGTYCDFKIYDLKAGFNNFENIKTEFIKEDPDYLEIIFDDYKEINLKGHSDDVLWCSFSSSGELIVSASSDKTLKIWDIINQKEVSTLNGHEGKVNTCDFFSNDRLIISASSDKTVRIWDVLTHKCVCKYSNGFEIKNITLSSDHKMAVLLDAEGKIYLVCLPEI